MTLFLQNKAQNKNGLKGGEENQRKPIFINKVIIPPVDSHVSVECAGEQMYGLRTGNISKSFLFQDIRERVTLKRRKTSKNTNYRLARCFIRGYFIFF